MTVSREVEELARRMMLAGDYASEDAVLLAGLQALEQRQPAGEDGRRPSTPQVSPLGARLREIREQYLAGGGALLTAADVDREIAQRRGVRDLGE
jgi:hypothetical protein